jgi:hypothetical protein
MSDQTHGTEPVSCSAGCESVGRALALADAAQAADDARDMAAKRALVHVDLVDDDVAQVGQEPACQRGLACAVPSSSLHGSTSNREPSFKLLS